MLIHHICQLICCFKIGIFSGWKKISSLANKTDLGSSYGFFSKFTTNTHVPFIRESASPRASVLLNITGIINPAEQVKKLTDPKNKKTLDSLIGSSKM